MKPTGHPYYDIGIETITAFVGKKHPEELDESDLEKVADYVAREYVRQPLRSFLTVVFPNSGFTQPAYFKQPEKQAEYANRILRSYSEQTPTLERQCSITGQPIPNVSFDLKDALEPGVVYRQHFPLLTGEGSINFFPSGQTGLPISGEALLAIQAFPLGCAKSAGRLLAVHSDNRELTFHFAKDFVEKNRNLVQLAQQSNSTKMIESTLKHRTLLIETLLSSATMQRDALQDENPFSITAYHLSNSGQGPGLDIYHLPMQIIGYLREMETAAYQSEWHAIVNHAWERAPKPKKQSKKPAESFKPSRNWLYEDLFRLPENAKQFIRTYFLRQALKFVRGDQDPRTDYSLNRDVNLVSWKITERFLLRILHMEQERIDAIRKMGDRFAEYINGQNDRRLFRAIYMEKEYWKFRNALIKANTAHVKKGNEPLLKLDSFIQVFEEGDELARKDWYLSRDLVLIRMVEHLHKLEWFKANSDVIEDDVETTEELA